MKKVLFVLMLLFSGLSKAETVTYSLDEMFIKIVQSETLSQSGKVFLMGFFDDIDPIQFEANLLSGQLCEEANLEELDLFVPSDKSCEENLSFFFLNFDKAGDLNLDFDIVHGPGGTTYTGSIGIKIPL